MFNLDNNAKTNMTSFHGVTIDLAPADLEAVFGCPRWEDGEKTQTEWDFSNDNGNVFTLYDWKQYGKQVRYSNDKITYHIGSKVGILDENMFKGWLQIQVDNFMAVGERNAG